MGSMTKLIGAAVAAAVILITAGGELAAQNAGEMSFGIRAGVVVGQHEMPEIGTIADSLVPPLPGASIGTTWHSATSVSFALYWSFAFTNWLSLQPELNFMLLQGAEVGMTLATMGMTQTMTVPIMYNSLDIPVLLRFTLLRNPIVAGVLGGPHFSIPMGSLMIPETAPIIPVMMAEASNAGISAGVFIGAPVGPGRILTDVRFIRDFLASTVIHGGETYELLRRRAFIFSLAYEIPITRQAPPAAAPAAASQDIVEALVQALAQAPLGAAAPSVVPVAAERQEPGVEIETVWINGGSFAMGSPAVEAGRFANESLPRQVRLEGFHMMTHPVTRHQWELVMGAGTGTGTGTGERLPVENVKWFEAIVFANRLSIMQGLRPAYVIGGSVNPDNWGQTPAASDPAWDAVLVDGDADGWRLPTEEQWEYAARAGTAAAFSNGTNNWGDEAALNTIGWFSFNSEGRIREVGTRAPNPWGLHDMHGNVWEWVWDMADAEGRRTARGGYWGLSARYARAAARTDGRAYTGYMGTGFRLVRP